MRPTPLAHNGRLNLAAPGEGNQKGRGVAPLCHSLPQQIALGDDISVIFQLLDLPMV